MFSRTGTRRWGRALIMSAALLPVFSGTAGAAAPTPQEYFGFQPGTDRQLVDYEQLVGYLQALDKASDRVVLQAVGTSPMGRTMYAAFISDPANLAELPRLKEINRALALEPELAPPELERLVKRGRVFLMETLSMHSSEVGPSQALPIIAHELATTSDPQITGTLSGVVLMVVPCHNPDGMDMVVKHYRSTVGTPDEGTSLPGLWHKYVGHDNNRDFVTLTQDDTRVINRLFSTEWYPQVLVEKHQMGRSGPRYFVPANHDPIAINVNEGLWNWLAVMGANLSRDMTAHGCQGVASHWLFDNYWPGSTETSLWKNVISLLTECASCRIATPVYVEPEELSTHGKGLSEYAKSVNMPDPWPGGWWRLSDIVHFERESTISMLKTASLHREEILRYRNQLCRKEIAEGRELPPAYFILPAAQHDPGELTDLVALLREHGVRVHRLTGAVEIDGRRFASPDVVVTLAQPYRAFIKEVMEPQEYPVRHYTPDGEVIRPYDIASWSLPLHRGLECRAVAERSLKLESLLEEIDAPLTWPAPKAPAGTPAAYGLSADFNQSYRTAFAALAAGLPVLRLDRTLKQGDASLPAGSFLLPAGADREKLQPLLAKASVGPLTLAAVPSEGITTLAMPKIGLVETWFHHMDAGWTRFIFDRFSIPYTVLRPAEISDTDLSRFDVLVFPDSDPGLMMEGRIDEGDNHYLPDLPPEYLKGIGDDGMLDVVDFLNNGGVVVAWGRSTGLFTGVLKERTGDKETRPFRLPVGDIGDRLEKKGLYIPGSLLRATVRVHPLTLGMPATLGVFSRGTPVLATSIPRSDMDRRVVVAFPENEDLLLSGYAEHPELLRRHAAAVWVRKGKGQLALMAFSPEFRASTQSTFKLLFNALLLAE